MSGIMNKERELLLKEDTSSGSLGEQCVIASFSLRDETTNIVKKMTELMKSAYTQICTPVTLFVIIAAFILYMKTTMYTEHQLQQIVNATKQTFVDQKVQIEADMSRICGIEKGELRNDLKEQFLEERRELESSITNECSNEKQQLRSDLSRCNNQQWLRDQAYQELVSSCNQQRQQDKMKLEALGRELEIYLSREANRGFFDHLGALIKSLGTSIQNLFPNNECLLN